MVHALTAAARTRNGGYLMNVGSCAAGPVSKLLYSAGTSKALQSSGCVSGRTHHLVGEYTA
jgi:hypothetical protein